jgi:hypothetical protein
MRQTARASISSEREFVAEPPRTKATPRSAPRSGTCSVAVGAVSLTEAAALRPKAAI